MKGTMRRFGSGTIGIVLFACATAGLSARDFAEAPRAILLPEAYPERGVAVAPAAWAELSYTPNTILDAEYDRFQIRTLTNVGLVAGPRTLASLFYGTYLLSGPVNEGTDPGSDRAPWLMNAVQFEYGLTLQRRMGAWTALAEYSRRSSHPLRSEFEEPAADILRVGVAPPPFAWGALAVRTMVRVGWVELWDFWEVETIPDPRVLYTANIAGEFEYRLPVDSVPVSLFAIVLWDPFILRSGGVDGDVECDWGVGVGERGRRIELYLNYYRSGDTEQGEEEAIPVVLIGYGIRFVASL